MGDGRDRSLNEKQQTLVVERERERDKIPKVQRREDIEKARLF